jgi:outer membrane protein TolC
MGAPQVEIPGVKALEPRAYPQLPLQQELDTAAKMRPNLKAMGQAQSAQAAGVRAARAEYGPRVNAYGNWEDDRSSLGGARGNSWVAGVQISVDIFPASKPAQLAKESAAKLMIDAQQAVSAQHVRLEVSRAHIHRQTAALTVETARAAKEQSAESLRIVRNRYNSGLATITDLLRAEDAERESQSRYWKAVNDNAVTYAELLYATGTLTPDATEELQ